MEVSGSSTGYGSKLAAHLRTFLEIIVGFGAPFFLLALAIGFVWRAFAHDIYAGVRSMGGVLVPLVMATFILAFWQSLLVRMGKARIWVGFTASVGWGFIAMLVLQLVARSQPFVPIGELVLSASFSVLVFGYLGNRGTRPSNILVYYYGVTVGLLLYIVLFGFPVALARGA